MISNEDKINLNILLKFLAKRDFESIERIVNFSEIDLAVIMPSAYMPVAYEMAKMYQAGVAKNYIIAGGVGHSTHYIAENIMINPKFTGIKTEGKSEAEMYYDVLNVLVEGIKHNVYLETKSENSGENAAFALGIADKKCLACGNVLVMQDPTMQMRTYLTFKKVWDAKIYSYTPKVPLVEENKAVFSYEMRAEGLWDEKRLISLIMGEMYRIEDNATGYGPNGKNFIAHIDIPTEVKHAYSALYSKFSENRMD